MKLLSIIIPMYNVAPYVERCIRSLEDQDIPHRDYELICINDGSPDNSAEIVTRLQEEFSNIDLINQENQGVSRARNNGIDKATGKYLLFIDPDDYVDPNSFSRILKSIDEKNSQVSFLGFCLLNEDGSLRMTYFNSELAVAVFPGIEAYFHARGDGRADPDRIWAVLFEREFIINNELRFLPNVPYLEDGELIARIMCLAERCTFDGQSFYQRTTRPGSATNSNLFRSEKAERGFILSAKNLKDFQATRKLNKTQIEFLNQPICKFVLLAVNSCVGRNFYIRIKNTRKNLKNINLQRCDLEGCNNLFKQYGRLYNISIFFAFIALLARPRIDRLNQVWKRNQNQVKT